MSWRYADILFITNLIFIGVIFVLGQDESFFKSLVPEIQLSRYYGQLSDYFRKSVPGSGC
jgi:hypothetical protein